MVKVSDNAKSKLAALMQEEGKQLEKTYISVGVESGGCSGLSYKMDFTPEMPENAVHANYTMHLKHAICMLQTVSCYTRLCCSAVKCGTARHAGGL